MTPNRTDTTTPCQHCTGTMGIIMVNEVMAREELEHSFECKSCQHSAAFRFPKIRQALRRAHVA